MKPIEFKEQNVVFAKDQPEYIPLPAHKLPDGTIVTVWELTDEEIETLRRTKKLHLNVMTFNQSLQPLFPFIQPDEIVIDRISETSVFSYKDLLELYNNTPIQIRYKENLEEVIRQLTEKSIDIKDYISHLKRENERLLWVKCRECGIEISPDQKIYSEAAMCPACFPF